MSIAEYRTATLSEIQLMLEWAALEGWNPGREDAAAFQAADPNGFFVAILDGQAIAAISVVNHSDGFAFLGLYICKPEYRGKGIGFGLWNYALNHAGSRVIGLDGVPEQEANYAKSGFVLAGRTRRLQGNIEAAALSYPLAAAGDFAIIEQLDKAANGGERPDFLKSWIKNCDTRKTVLLYEGGEIAGFATARICIEGCKIAPIIAPTLSSAFDLAVQAAAAVGQTNVIIDTPDAASDFGEVLESKGFIETFRTARMYRGMPPKTGDRLRAIATMELG